MSETHPAYWEPFPTVDHLVPITKDGTNTEANCVTTSMLRNSAKANWTIEELGWVLYPPGDLERWDGLVHWFLKGGKNDGNDAEAMCEAVARPGMHFVLVKSTEQQAVLCLHRIRQGLIKDGTAAIHQLRGLVMPQCRYPAQHSIPRILEDGENGLPLRARRLPAMHRARLLKRVFDIDIDKPGMQTYHGKLLRTQQCPRVAAAP
jgi:hypothetical protein